MASFNRVILVGNLTRDPELAHTASNLPVCKFGIATNRRWRDRNTGEQREEVCFVDCVCFGRGGEVINQYMSKGRSMLVEGRLHYNQWEDQSGNKRSKLDVYVDNFTFLGGPGGQPAPGQAARAGAPAPQAVAPAPSAQPQYGQYGAPQYQEYSPPLAEDYPSAPSEDYGPPIDDNNVPF